jgi:AbrB family looped-hinge helix DNA binding protein
MPVSTVTTKGQITIPKEIRDALELASGDRVAFRLRDDHVVEMVPETVDPLSLFGVFKPRVRGITVAAMDQAIRTAATTRGRPKK